VQSAWKSRLRLDQSSVRKKRHTAARKLVKHARKNNNKRCAMKGDAWEAPMLGQQLLEVWQNLPLNPDAQLKTVREYATRVLGGELSASAWLGRANPAILDGRCVVSEACRTREGFQAALLELIRVSNAVREQFVRPKADENRPDHP
jgi:hypothetical protein